MTDHDKKQHNMETDLTKHKRYKKQLHPPFAQLKFAPSSWIDDRMPNMLWAVLAIGEWKRDNALAFFRYIAKFVESNPDCYNVTLTGIGKLSPQKRSEFIRYVIAWDSGAKELLRPLMLFSEIPGITEWKLVLGDPIPKEDWTKLADAVNKSLWHQSEKATDCRWVKLLCQILGGKMKFTSSMEDTLRGIFEYPNYGDLTRIQPFIRASEISPDPTELDNPDIAWPSHFWKTCLKETLCVPEGAVQADQYDDKAWDTSRKHYLEETQRIRISIIEHFLHTTTTTAIDARHSACFGFVFYAFTLFTEIILHRADYSVSGRLVLRSLTECFITFTYLLKKDNPELWQSYRAYGTGQAKLVYLKMQELKEKPLALDEKMMREIANEDMWQEFLSINIGHWDNTDLRKMSEEVGLKDLYDQYYTWTSSYIHANWAALREAVYEKCINPLHRLHHVPTAEFTKLPSVVLDAQNLANNVFALLAKAYPSFEDRIKSLPPLTPPEAKSETQSEPL